jgi:fibronectin type 3 domain-containing protein
MKLLLSPHQKLLLSLIIALLTVSAVAAQSIGPTNAPTSVTLAWNASPATGYGPIGYNMYYGPSSATYTNKIVSNTNLTLTVSNLVRGATVYFAVTATTTNGLESVFSNEISYQAPPPPLPPTVLRIISQ